MFNEHVYRAGLDGNLQGKVILELGPGDSIATALVAACYGAQAILLDAGSFATVDIERYRSFASELDRKGLSPPNISKAETLDDILFACDAIYLTRGLASFASIEDGIVDLIFSQAVLEHIRKHEFLETMQECERVLSSKGVASHQVDLKDHLGGSLNNLRFSERLWESELFVSSGFYTNRIRFSEMLTLFEEARFLVKVCNVDRWNGLPVKRQVLAKEYMSLSDDELMVSGFDVLMHKE